MSAEDEGSGSRVKHTISFVERALRRMSEQAGRGVRGVALPATVAGPPLPNWTQVLLRELRRGFWRKGRAAVDSAAEGGGPISGGNQHSLFVAADGAALSWGTGMDEDDEEDPTDGRLGHGESLVNSDVPLSIEALVGVRVCTMSAGGWHSLVLAEDGTVYSCGYGGHGRLGHGNEENQDVPKLIEALSGMKVCAVSAGLEHSLFLMEDGRVYSCGGGDYSQLGHGNTEDQLVPTLIEALSGMRVCAVSAGYDHSLFLTEDGKVYSCGSGDYGKHGHGYSEEDQHVPKLIEALSGVRVCAVSASGDHSLFVTEDGKVYSCGWGRDGQLGHGNT
eukprot:g2991.t1